MKDGNFSMEQAEWLLKEHARQQEYLASLYDDEISRQRMLLNEKIARRKALGAKVVSEVTLILGAFTMKGFTEYAFAFWMGSEFPINFEKILDL